jgi:serine/threonine-protein kinase
MDTFVKVLDFGVAKFMGPELGMTTTGALMGTPYYASPEQLIDPKSIDHRADLWSVAVVTYACLTAKLPFTAETLGALTIKIHKSSFERPSRLRAELPAAVDIWMNRALSTDRARRFATALELAESLTEALKGPRAAPGRALPQATVVMAPTSDLDRVKPPGAVTVPMQAVEAPHVAGTSAPVPATVPQPVGGHMKLGPHGLDQSTLSPTSAGAQLSSTPPVPVVDATLAAAPDRKGKSYTAVAAAALIGVVGAAGAVVYGRSATTSGSGSAAPVVTAAPETESTPVEASVQAETSAPPHASASASAPPSTSHSAPPTATAHPPVVPRPPPPLLPPPPPPADDNPFKKGSRR